MAAFRKFRELDFKLISLKEAGTGGRFCHSAGHTKGARPDHGERPSNPDSHERATASSQQAAIDQGVSLR